jgi:outer membrane protein assembly factor BamA
LAFLLCCACSGTKYLQEKQYLLDAQIIKGNKEVSAYDLVPFFRQKPNRKIPLLGEPYVVAYYVGKKSYDQKVSTWQQEMDSLQKNYVSFASKDSIDEGIETKSIKASKSDKLNTKIENKINDLQQKIEKGNWLMQSVGDVPVIFDSTLMVKTASQMQLFLKQKGFFKAKVTPSFSIKKKHATVTYLVDENKPRLIYRFLIESKDSTVLQIIKKNEADALVKAGKRFDESALSNERDRIGKLLQNEGYMMFGKQFIYFDVDTVNADKDSLDVRLTIAPNEEKGKPIAHQQFKIGEVNMITDVGVIDGEDLDIERTTETYKGINYLAFKHKYSKKLLNARIRIRPEDLYNRSKIEDTQRALAALDVFKFVNVKPDTINNILRTNIFASPAPLNDISIETGLNMVQTFPGPFVGITLKNRNTFKGCETLELRGRYSLEAQAGVIGTGQGYVGQEVGVNATLNFPKLLLFGERFNNRIGAYLPRTRLIAGYTDIIRPEYSRTNFRTALTYDWTDKKNSTFSLNLFDMTVVNTREVTDDFVKYLFNISAGGNTLLKSFDRLFISSISLNYTYFNNKNFYIRALGELGGTTLNLLSNSIFKEDKGAIFGLTIFRYVKANVEVRRYFDLKADKTRTLILRANMGIITPYGQIDGKPNTVLPYEKYFFTGGTSSLRAWRPRRLGPGSFAFIDGRGEISDLVEQPGEMLLEMNLEVRQKLFGFVHGAFFVDAGNIWMLNRDSRAGSQFLARNFWKEIAVGTGLGLRFDFSLVIMRFDFGIKVWNPALPESQRFVLPQWKLSETTLNVGIGYPF